MATWTLTTINTSIENTLATATGITRSQDLSELTENIPEMDLPLLMVYPQTIELVANSSTMKNTFGSSPAQQHKPLYHCDVYIAPVGGVLRDIIPTLVTTWQNVLDVFKAQTEAPFFGDSAIKAFSVTSERIILDYSQQSYHGIRFAITVTIF